MRAVRALACVLIVSLALSTICKAAAAPAPQLSADSLSALGTGFSKKLASALRQQQAQQAVQTQSTDANASPMSASEAKVATAAAGSSATAAASTAAVDVFEVEADSKGYYGDEYDQYYVTPKITLGDYLQKLFADLDKEYEAVEKEFKEGIEASREGLYQKLHGRKGKEGNRAAAETTCQQCSGACSGACSVCTGVCEHAGRPRPGCIDSTAKSDFARVAQSSGHGAIQGQGVGWCVCQQQLRRHGMTVSAAGTAAAPAHVTVVGAAQHHWVPHLPQA